MYLKRPKMPHKGPLYYKKSLSTLPNSLPLALSTFSHFKETFSFAVGCQSALNAHQPIKNHFLCMDIFQLSTEAKHIYENCKAYLFP